MVKIEPDIDYTNSKSPIIESIYNCYKLSIREEINKNYFSRYGDVKKWACFSDYSLDEIKCNNVITFTFFPYIIDLDVILPMIKALSPSDIKKTRSVNPGFVDFLKNGPFLSFAVVLPRTKYLLGKTLGDYKESLLLSLKNITDYIPSWTVQHPHMEQENLKTQKTLERLKKEIQRGKKLNLTRNMLLITSIGATWATIVANRTNATVMGWFSDRDAINDIENHLSNQLFNIQFIQKTKNFPNVTFLTAHASSQDEIFYDELIRIPDYISGTIADLNFTTNTTTHKKFTPILESVLADNRTNIFTIKLIFDIENETVGASRILFNSTKNAKS